MASALIKVDAAELERLWFTDDAIGLVVDEDTGARVIRMRDGTRYTDGVPENTCEETG